jgi:hypothetical protein
MSSLSVYNASVLSVVEVARGLVEVLGEVGGDRCAAYLSLRSCSRRGACPHLQRHFEVAAQRAGGRLLVLDGSGNLYLTGRLYSTGDVGGDSVTIVEKSRIFSSPSLCLWIADQGNSDSMSAVK